VYLLQVWCADRDRTPGEPLAAVRVDAADP